VRRLAVDEGLNALVARQEVREIAIDSPLAFDDLDSPDDYARIARSEQERIGDETTRADAVFYGR
jgi:hypothetical protein